VSGVKPGADAILRAWRAADAAGTQAEARIAWPRIARRIGRPGSTALAFLACAVAGTALLWAAADFPRKGLPESRRRGLMGLTRDQTMKSIQAAPASKFLSATLAATAMLAPDAMAQNAAKQWRVEDGGNGHWYAARRWDFPKTWPEARDAAIARGGYLACVTSAAESQWLGANMTLEQPGCGLGRMGWHLGGYQDRSAPDYAEPASGWRWVSGERWAFTAWLTEANYPGLQGGDRPNNFGNDEQYLKMSELPYAPWWDDVGTTSDQNDLCGAIIEWSADCNGDGVVDYGQCRDGSLADYDGNNVPDCCERGEKCLAGTFPFEWTAESGGNGHWYGVTAAITSWDQALINATAAGGSLASIASSSENNLLLRMNMAANYCWIGLRKLPGQPWSWSDGTVTPFTAWCPGEPCCFDNGLYVFMHQSGCWDDHNQQETPHRGLIEWSADCDNDGQVDIGQILRGEALDANANGVPDNCEITCADADLYANGEINGADLGILLSEWGVAVPGSRSDIDGDGLVNGVDLAYVLAFWGPCGG
jgi:hypothetical protein